MRDLLCSEVSVCQCSLVRPFFSLPFGVPYLTYLILVVHHPTLIHSLHCPHANNGQSEGVGRWTKISLGFTFGISPIMIKVIVTVVCTVYLELFYFIYSSVTIIITAVCGATVTRGINKVLSRTSFRDEVDL